ncbi:MAG: PaaI family thioesterase [Bradymonadia bacterium]
MVTCDAINAMIDELWPDANVECVALCSDHARVQMPVAEHHLRPGAFISGPAQFSCADAALWFLSSGALGRVEPMAVTQELSIRFLRPAVGTRLFAEAKLERQGRHSLVASVRVWTTDEDSPTAVAQGTYQLPNTDSHPMASENKARQKTDTRGSTS